MDAYSAAASGPSSALAVYLFSWIVVTVLFLFVFPLYSTPQVCHVHHPLRLSSCHVYASRLLGVVRAVRKATIRMAYVFSLLLSCYGFHVSVDLVHESTHAHTRPSRS
ncbi:hypothetical protein EV421DRAFT_1805119 [Armillaria borealis]|uniref:Uncharacterized protein n=1 Tax=Armillaria borealis TaxID=47425 RepID=A0AA39JJ67_9AGAR|nr:hypothetical protein EV421DRAFT_1805119 [Armillaria borealis]